MTRPRFLLALAAGLTGLIAGPAYAHGFGERTQLPIPLGYFIIGAAVTVAVSFFIVSFFVRATPGASYRRSNLFRVGWLQKVSNSPLLLVPLKAASVFLLGLVIATGLAGVQDPVSNFAPTLRLGSLVGRNGLRDGVNREHLAGPQPVASRIRRRGLGGPKAALRGRNYAPA